MSEQPVVLYEAADGVARLTLNRPERGNAITPRLIAELVECVGRADLDPAVHVLLLAGAGTGFCGGYDLLESAEGMGAGAEGARTGAEGTRVGAGAGRGATAPAPRARHRPARRSTRP